MSAEMTGSAGNIYHGLFLKALKEDHLAHAYLFLGQETDTKTETIGYLARLLICFDDREPLRKVPCGECIHCIKMARGSHPDFIELSPEGAFIKIEQIRWLQDSLKFPPLESIRRVCIINSAHRLHPSAANALLKTLEEPPANTHFFLSATSRGSLLPTIVSRCQVMRLGMNLDDSQRSLEEMVLDYDTSLKGQVTLDEVEDIKEKIYRFLSASGDEQMLAYFDCIREISKGREILKAFLIIFRFIARDILLLWGLGETGKGITCKDRIYCKEFHKELAMLARRLNYDSLIGLQERIRQSDIFLSRNVKGEMIADRILLYLMKNRRDCRDG